MKPQRCILILIMFIHTLAIAQIYKCTDQNGNLTFQDHDCKNGVTVDRTDITTYPAPGLAKDKKSTIPVIIKTGNDKVPATIPKQTQPIPNNSATTNNLKNVLGMPTNVASPIGIAPSNVGSGSTTANAPPKYKVMLISALIWVIWGSFLSVIPRKVRVPAPKIIKILALAFLFFLDYFTYTKLIPLFVATYKEGALEISYYFLMFVFTGMLIGSFVGLGIVFKSTPKIEFGRF